jgi:hypothetical protein
MERVLPPTCIDHLVITAPSLAVGAAYVREALGVETEMGGEHRRMGTHNRLLRLSSSSYLEVIAPDPAAGVPARPRWFDLDRRHPEALPALAAWAARTNDIVASAAGASEPLGTIEAMCRGALDWAITIPADGTVPVDGVGPALIEWRTGTHPAAHLPDRGLALLALEILHPDCTRVARLLASIAFDGPLTLSPLPPSGIPHLVAHIDTPQGRRALSLSATS